MKNALLGFLLLISSLCSCEKDSAPATPPPDTNANGEYFNCKIDGKYWTYKQASYTMHDALTARKGPIARPGYVINGDNGGDYPYTLISFWMVGVDFPNRDTVELTSYSDSSYAELLGPNETYSGLDFITDDSLHKGKIIFTKRTSQCLEGTFSFDAISREAGTPVVHVTEGRFSVIP